MAPATSPSIAALAGGGYEIAFNNIGGDLSITGNGGDVQTSNAMMARTSPAIVALAWGSFEVAFHGNTGNLWTYSPPSGGYNTGQAMAVGTSPGLAP